MIAFGITDKGKVRSINQDTFNLHIDPDKDRAVLTLCDGMGGEKAGEIASSMACSRFMSHALEAFDESIVPLSVDIARESAAWANLCVYDRAYSDDACSGMGTTLVAAVINGMDAAVVNVGDSRCYWMAEGQLQQITRDHSWVQEQVDMGLITPDEAKSHPRKNLITRALGLQRRIRSDIFRIDLQRGDTLLLCSDGLSNLLSEQEITETLTTEESVQTACRRLLQTALRRGAPDNVTVLILRR